MGYFLGGVVIGVAICLVAEVASSSSNSSWA